MIRKEEYLIGLVKELIKLPHETQWLEFKVDNGKPDEIGEYISALSNGAALEEKSHGYLIWGIEDSNHEVVGTNFDVSNSKVGNEQLENWLLRLLTPRIYFRFSELVFSQKRLVILEVERANVCPVQFKNTEYIRVGSYKKLMKDYPEIERKLWRTFDHENFEDLTAKADLQSDEVLQLIDYPSYFSLMELPLPEDRFRILEKLEEELIIKKSLPGNWNITNLGASLFARKLSDFNQLKRKAVRVIQYSGNSRIETLREQEINMGYACGFEGLISYVSNLLPHNEIIGQAIRKEVAMYPELAIRELVANALIHQDFTIRGTGPMIEIFSERMEITNPGTPLVSIERFIDSPPKSRNESLAVMMRRIGVCEERGSGFDKVVYLTELFQLPSPIIEATEAHTKVTIFAHLDFKVMSKEDKVRACYWHCCLKYVNREYMTNTSLRERFGLENKDAPVISRILKDAMEMKYIKLLDTDTNPRYYKYVPFWV